MLDEADLVRRTDELAQFIVDAAAQYGFDPRRVVAVGYSNGANVAASLLLLHPSTLAGAVLFHPMVPLVPAQPADLSATPVFISAGRADPLVPAEQTVRLASLLSEMGASVAVHWHPGGHTLTDDEFRAARTWLRLSRMTEAP